MEQLLERATDMLPLAATLSQAGERVALLESPAGSTAAHAVHLLVLEAPGRGRPDPATASLCVAGYDHGLDLLGVRSRHEDRMGLLAYPVAARLTLDRLTGTTLRTGDTERLDVVGSPAPQQPPRVTDVRATHEREAFADMVERAQAYIADGHTYQANLSLRLDAAFDGDVLALYDALRSMNPSPYQALLVSPECTLVSASPELLLRVRGERLVTRPIAGTRPRGEDPAADAALERELVADAKERAEHAMLVDLARNDLGRVAAFGSVHVSDDAVIERYSHVMHIVSEVRARLATDATAWDAFEAVFPCGTITGAPKRRSCEIIDELEPVGRGAYTGSMGLVGPDESVWNILIRTLVLRDDRIRIQAGAGVVADSDPAREYEECIAKAAALMRTVGLEAPG